MDQEKPSTINKKMYCFQCGGALVFDPLSQNLKCGSCHTLQPLDQQNQRKAIIENDLEFFIAHAASLAPVQQIHAVSCPGCGASTTFPENTVSAECSFCATPIVIAEKEIKNIIKPAYLLPFKVEKNEAVEHFQNWLASLWFAPNDLTKYSSREEKLAGMYLPFWTYDAKSTTDYDGERGVYYYVDETYDCFENGKTVTKTRQVRHTRWSPAGGTVYNRFNDILIFAAKSLPREYVDELEPWDLEALVAFDEDYLKGFQCQTYQIDLNDGFLLAGEIMLATIRDTVLQDIGGDEQKIHRLDPHYRDISFKHILLPLWQSAFNYQGTIYHFMINARTGEVQGERPYSWIKISLTVFTLMVIIYFIIRFYG